MSVTVSRILHAGYVLECGKTRIAFDPIFENPFSRNCFAFPAVQFDQNKIRNQKFDAVFISHYHDDHCSFTSLDLLDRKTPIYMYCVFEEMFSLLRELGFQNVQALKLNESVQIGDFEVITHPALDIEVDSIFQIRAGGLNILNVVDSWIDPETLVKLAKIHWDLILWPFQTMRELEVLAPEMTPPTPPQLPEEWIPQLKALSPRFLVPSSCQFLQESWSWYNHAFFPISYQFFQMEMEKHLPKTKVVRMNPSVSIELSSNSLETAPALAWVLPVGEQNVDYVYRPNLKPPETAEIAKHFAELKEQQIAVVRDYCESGLIEKYNSLPAPVEPFFDSPRVWQLSIYDHLGQEQKFFYQVHAGKIQKGSESEPEWTTEVPLSKLYAALEMGESLTSMYLRVFCVDHVVDIIEDPLIRCLFNGEFASYQKAQFRTLVAAEQK